MNKYSFQLTNRAREDINQAFVWYDYQRFGLGDEFYDYLQQNFNHLTESPFLYAPYRIHYRKMVLRRFPYSVIYQVIEAELTVIVIAVMHQKRSDVDLLED